ncbi:MAG: PqqD family protein, partial [Deltaproteobacteria bacterium]|nr:PqqD family protein [Deltaproteobacteria bacterium]
MDKKNLINLESVVVQVVDLVSSSLDEETVMMSVNSGKYYGLDEIGSRIWELIKQPRSVSDLCDILLGEFEV